MLIVKWEDRFDELSLIICDVSCIYNPKAVVFFLKQRFLLIKLEVSTGCTQNISLHVFHDFHVCHNQLVDALKVGELAASKLVTG